MNAANLTAEEMANLLAKELNRRFSSSELDSLARQTGFVQRSGKCTPQDFVSLCVFSTQSVATDSLVHLSIFITNIPVENTSKEQIHELYSLRLVQRMEQAGCKSHRYEKKTVFDILGVAYEQHRQKDKAT
ncbi:hypothetical protein [Alicyclobacillus mengziensis]|uniref:Uncharacterized protein n=1 Tax=Alicyclobacillus mengziensis TaxID=2931921 RepID=A0A9X7Z807_9BACL|nr:hypothetical protein [Alicyclobacillus mengziensis]QSO47763.1 hypothetical protein JZ786_01550 [Alicyclobacillus mengziensis]